MYSKLMMNPNYSIRDTIVQFKKTKNKKSIYIYIYKIEKQTFKQIICVKLLFTVCFLFFNICCVYFPSVDPIEYVVKEKFIKKLHFTK